MNLHLILRPAAYSLIAVVLVILIFCLLIGCGRKKPDFSGTYVCRTDGQYSIADDTLIISRDHRIERRTGFYSNGEHRYEVEHWQADLNEETGCLIERRYGKVISLTEEGILVGKRAYMRVPIRVTIHNFLEHL